MQLQNALAFGDVIRTIRSYFRVLVVDGQRKLGIYR